MSQPTAIYLLYDAVFPTLLCLAGTPSLSFSQPRVHHSSGCLPDQHHGLWGVCPTHPSASLLSSWVHLQLWDRCSEVTNTLSVFYFTSTSWITKDLCTVCTCSKLVEYSHTGLTVRKLCFCISITYNGSMESPVPLYPTDCPPPYEAVMGQRAASQVSMCVCISVICL